MCISHSVIKKIASIVVLFILMETSAQSQTSNMNSIDNQDKQIQMVILGVLVPVVVLFVFGFFFYYRLRRESYFRETQLELKFAKSEMELRALRAQVNPHFIFNSLSSIQHAIHHKNTIQAENHLIKFSRLIRQVLEHSSSSFISLHEDLEVLELYLELEILRLDGLFSYEITLEKGINKEEVYVPPLLLQPLVENAIWHGLSNRTSSDGKLTVHFQEEKGAMVCYITDNGVKNKNQSNHKGNSHGLRLVEERIKLHSSESNDRQLQLKELISTTGYNGMQVRVEIPTEQKE